ncbi:Ig-like domain-containing protein [Methylobacterium sp. Leaf118]|uniref:Ig-like domain-containing protein n=1 Tax=Methylobacterium sp. Leaf118 TaxID=2876562 RepID=UPI001E58DE40|nr:Ig-like domain-containing protein [Methylobacterium sp. Leaf118]
MRQEMVRKGWAVAPIPTNTAPKFAGGGTGKVLTPIGLSDDVAYGVTVQPDGKIVVTGYGSVSNYDFAVVRYNANGTLDTGFGTGGKIVTPVGSEYDEGRSVTVQPDGKIVVAGYGYGSDSNYDFAVVRYNTDGTLDTSFGTILTPVGAGDDTAYSVTMQADGKIVVAGTSFSNDGSQDFAVVRYNADGTLDTGFGTGGTIVTPFGLRSNDGRSVTVQADGKIVVAGFGPASDGNYDFAVVRYNVDGTLDTGFGNGGTIVTPVGTAGDFAYSVTMQSDSKIVVSGYSFGSDGTADFAVVRYNTDGTLDTGFGTGGKILTPVGTSTDVSFDVTMQADGKIVVAGYGLDSNGFDFAVVRYNADGTLDTGFGTGGKILTPVGVGNDLGFSVTVQTDGKIVVAGYGTGSDGSQDFAVVRYNVDGTLDTSFGPIDTLGGSVGFTEGDLAIRLSSDVAITDLECDALNGGLGDYAGAELTLARSGGANAQDVFGFDPNGFVVSGQSLETIGGDTFATFTDAGGSLVIHFTGTNVATSALVTAVARAVTYANTADAPPPSVAIAWHLSDGGSDAMTATGTTTVTLTGINDAPSPTADILGITQRLTESGNLLANDSDPDGDTLSITAVGAGPGTNPPAFNGEGQAIGRYGTLTVEADGTYAYAAIGEGGVAVGEVVTDTFTYRVSDGALGQTTTLTFELTGSGLGTADSNSFLLTHGTSIATGLGGSDRYFVDEAGDQVIEAIGDGRDTVATTASYALAAGQEIEELRVAWSAGDQAIGLTGNEFAQILRGNEGGNLLDGRAGADTLDGGGGADFMIGGTGSDTYIVDNAGDLLIEAVGGGRDAVAVGASYTLTARQEIEEVRVLLSAGDQAINLTGNTFAQTVIGNNGANVLDGGWGKDVLTGRGGADTFLFNSALGTNNVDRITDFASEDTIGLSRSIFKALATGELDPGRFKNITTGTADADDRILYKQSTGELFYDADGLGSRVKMKFAVLDHKPALSSDDIFVV